MYPEDFEYAVNHAMIYEVGPFWRKDPSPEVEQGLIDTPKQRRMVGYVDDPVDRGGETKFGIAKNSYPDVDIKALTWPEAKEIYFQDYWIRGSCDQLPSRVAILHFDGCVNHGFKRANIFLQRAVNVEDDGIIGPQTLGAVNSADPFAVCESVCIQRENFYKDIVNRRPEQRKFLNGWMRRIHEMRRFVLDPRNQF